MKPYPETPSGLLLRQDGPVLEIRLDRPQRRNSLTDAMVYTLVDVFDAVGNDESVRVVHLSGTGDHFCSGFDLGERTPGPDQPRVGSIHRRMNGHVNKLIPTMLTTQTPIVCSAKGWVIGLGLSLALASDFTVVADDARLWAPFVTFGFTADSGSSWLVPRLAGVAHARQMLMLGEKIDGATAASWGLVHEAVPVSNLERTTNDLLTRLATAPTVAVGLMKLLIHRGLTADIDRHLADEGSAMEVASRSEDFKEFGRANREQRKPNFGGR